METIEVPAGHGRAFYVGEGKRFRIITPKGQQSADFFAFRADDISACLSPHHTWMPTRSLHPRVGDSFLDRRRQPMIDFVEDGAEMACTTSSSPPVTPSDTSSSASRGTGAASATSRRPWPSWVMTFPPAPWQ